MENLNLSEASKQLSEVKKLIHFFHNGHFRDAEILAIAITKEFPKCQFAWKLLGVLLQQKGDYSEAENANRKAAALDPRDAEAHVNLGVSLQNLGRFVEAEASLRRALVLNSNFAECYFNLGNTLQSLGRGYEALNSYKRSIELKPDLIKAYNNLGVLQKKRGELTKAKSSFAQAVTLKPDFFEAQSNLGVVLKDLGLLGESEVTLKKLVFLKPDYKEGHFNLGNTLLEMGMLKEAEASFREAIKISSNYEEAHENLAFTLLSFDKVEEAAEHFHLSSSDKGATARLNCLYKLDDKLNFYLQLNHMIDRGISNASIGSLISQSNIRYRHDRDNPFCNEPLKYVSEISLLDKYDFGAVFVEGLDHILVDREIEFRSQGLLNKGFQTAGNLLQEKNSVTDEIKKIILSEIEIYRSSFKDSKEGIFKNWPTNFSLNGWVVKMKSGGSLDSHIHENGWISGSIYINVPTNLNGDSGNLVLCVDDSQYGSEETSKSLSVTTGTICLFPSSLHHYTIPFESEEDRIVLAFDLVPDN